MAVEGATGPPQSASKVPSTAEDQSFPVPCTFSAFGAALSGGALGFVFGFGALPFSCSFACSAYGVCHAKCCHNSNSKRFSKQNHSLQVAVYIFLAQLEHFYTIHFRKQLLHILSALQGALPCSVSTCEVPCRAAGAEAQGQGEVESFKW